MDERDLLAENERLRGEINQLCECLHELIRGINVMHGRPAMQLERLDHQTCSTMFDDIERKTGHKLDDETRARLIAKLAESMKIGFKPQ